MKRFKFGVIVLAIMFIFGFAGPASAATTTVDLKTAGAYAILAYSGITNTGATTVAGDVGSSATPTQTGFDTVTFTSGTNHTAADPNDAATVAAKVDLTAAYTDAAARTGATTVTASGTDSFAGVGYTLVPGVYKSGSSIGLTGTLTLDAQGDTNAVWIFQAVSSLTTASASSVSLINGAQACNVFWQVGSSATLGTTTTFVGNILALESISLTNGATVNGRLLAQTGAVTLIHNTITASTCTTPSAEAAAAAAAYTATKAAAAAAAAAASATAGLPKTGGTPFQSNLLWYAVLLADVLALSTLLAVVLKKRS